MTITDCPALVTDNMISTPELYMSSHEDQRISLMGGRIATDAQIDYVLSRTSTGKCSYYGYYLSPYTVRGVSGKQAFIDTGILTPSGSAGLWMVHDVRGYADILRAVNNSLAALTTGDVRVIVTASPTKDSSIQSWSDELAFAIMNGDQLIRTLNSNDLDAIWSKIDPRLVGDKGPANLLMGLLD